MSPVKPGVEVFLEKHLNLVQGKKVGLVTNPSGCTRGLKSTVEVFYESPDINLVALYSPEHGVRGNAQAGEYVPFVIDEKFNLPVFSLYGQSRKPEKDMMTNIDAFMRSFDTVNDEKIPQASMVKNLDVLVFDIQDIGTRIYTYAATMAYCMRVCAENGIKFIVLDRPNPVNGTDLEGPLLEYPEYSSFLGLYPIPVRHGMTVGELALFYNDNFFEKKATLTVVPVEGWIRTMWYDETGLPWIFPSPNMPTLETAIVYPGQVFLEGTNVSEGRGTTHPFELFGAPWIDGYDLCLRLNRLNLPGVRFREAWFTPTFSKYTGERCGGAQIHILDRKNFRPFSVSLYVIKTIQDLYPEKFQFYEEYFDKIMGTAQVRLSLINGKNVEDILAVYEVELKEFSKRRAPYLLYGSERRH
ncbi:MAG: DUF1343 domain-containing protein [Candidatus Aminicenantes bacterium]|nr:DUF1343 domain-containing protein [Candidatus Aminicenantes bacterium]